MPGTPGQGELPGPHGHHHEPDRHEAAADEALFPVDLVDDLGCGRIVVSEIEIPNMLANLVRNGCAAEQSDNATEPYDDHAAEGRDEEEGHRRNGEVDRDLADREAELGDGPPLPRAERNALAQSLVHPPQNTQHNNFFNEVYGAQAEARESRLLSRTA